MPGVSGPANGVGVADPETGNQPRRTLPIAPLIDVVASAVVFVALAVAGAFVWRAVTDLPVFTRSAQGGLMDQVQLAKAVSIDGWFFTIGAVGGLVGGAVLMLVRRSRPILMVVLTAAAGALASWVMLQAGLHLGPPDPDVVLRSAAPGTHVPVQLRTMAHSVEFAWPLGGLLGGLLVLLLVSPRRATQGSSSEAD